MSFTSGVFRPFSRWEIDAWLRPMLSASSFCVSPDSSRSAFSASPTALFASNVIGEPYHIIESYSSAADQGFTLICVKKMRHRLEALLRELGYQKAKIGLARSRYKVQHHRAVENHNVGHHAKILADYYRRQHKPALGRKEDKKAARADHRAYRSHLKAQYWLGVIKSGVQKQEGLEGGEKEFEAAIAKWEREHGPFQKGENSVKGGKPRDRIKFAALLSARDCAIGDRHNFYQQEGTWDVNHCLTGEAYGERSDCSSWFTSVYKTCGLPDPNGENFSAGYTGTLGTHGKWISRSQLQPGDAILFGTAPFHHVELYIGEGKTIGHGSAPVNQGIVDLFGVGYPQEYRTFV
jgi:hypothetical protein